MEPLKPPTLLSLPREVLHGIIANCNPIDLAALSKSCSSIRACIHSNRLLHRDTYLNAFDEPPRAFFGSDPDWEQLLKEVVKLERLFDSPSAKAKQSHLDEVVRTVSHLLDTAPVPSESVRHPFSRNVYLLSKAFKSRANVNAFLCSSTLFARAGTSDQVPAKTEKSRQASAKLHVLYGVPVNPELHPTHQNARSKVYDLRNYTTASFWGPFMDDASCDVDWEKLEAIMVVLGFNMRQFSNRTHGRFPQLWRSPFLGAQPSSYVTGDFRSFKDQQLDDLTLKDPYGITGTWMRVVCFLDYSDLYTYNFANPNHPASEPREPLDTEEAIRLITMKLKVTGVEEPEEDMGQDLPVVYFTGTSRSMHAGWDPNANSAIRGRVHLTRQGEIRWTTWSVFHGEERWRSEGVQVGGLRSARGVWGNWFDKDFEAEGPAGPTAFWKLTDELPSRGENAAHDAAAQQQVDALQNMLALQNTYIYHPAAVNTGGYQLHFATMGNVLIAGASSNTGGGRAADVDADDSMAALHGTTHPHPYYQSIDSDDEVDATNEGWLAVGAAVGVAPVDDDSDSTADEDYRPAEDNGRDGTRVGDDDSDDDIPPPGGDDIVIEEAYVEEEMVPVGEQGSIPDGEEILVIGGQDGAPGVQ